MGGAARPREARQLRTPCLFGALYVTRLSGTQRSRTLGIVELLETGATIALLAGAAHVAFLLGSRYLLHHFVHVSREFIWMAPLAFSLVIFAGAVPLLALQAIAPRLRDPRITVGWLTLLGLFGVILDVPRIAPAASLVFAIGAASRVAQAAYDRLDGWRRGTKRLSRRLAAAVGVLAFGQLAMRAMRESQLAGTRPALVSAPNVLIIILDTVRAEALSLYGFSLETAPTLSRWAAEGTVFDWAVAPAPWTLPSHASMFSGRAAGELAANWTTPHDSRTAMLAEAFRKRGYRSAGFVGNLEYTAWDSGLDRGFSRYDDFDRSLNQVWWSSSYAKTDAAKRFVSASQTPRRADAITRGFLRWQAGGEAQPFFAFLNYYDAHETYFHPPGSPVLGEPGTAMSEYLSAIRWLDTNVGRVLDTLRVRGALDNTIVIVTSDHGELFDEHGLSGHAHSLYRNVLHVPLLLRYPARVPAGARVVQQVSMSRLAATVVDLAGLPAGAFPGESLRKLWEGPSTPAAPVLAEVRRAPNVASNLPTASGDLAALLDDSLHYIVSTSGREEVFRYRTDTAESQDLALSGDRASRLAALRQALGRIRRDLRR